MSVGVDLSDEDLAAVRLLYKVRWTARLTTWKERDTDYCMWFVECPDQAGGFITETGQSLSDTIYRLLASLDMPPERTRIDGEAL
jgi:hypothetical protein